MTNQLTYTDLDTTTIPAAPRPARTLPSTFDEQPKQPKQTSSGRGWLLIAGGAALAVTAIVGLAVAGTDSPDPIEVSAEQRPAYLIIQDEIDAALAEKTALAEQAAAADLNARLPAYLIIQNEIDQALAERNGAVEDPRSAAQIIQDEIDAALTERDAASVDVAGG